MVCAWLSSGVVGAHDCGPSQIRLKVGERLPYRIAADVSESEPTRYEMVINSDPSVAAASPDNFFSLGFGEFIIEGIQPGTNKVLFEWVYAPNNAAGNCLVEVIVEPRISGPPATASTSGNQPLSAQGGDPVNLLTGELVLQPPPDLILPGPQPVIFERYYASRLSRDQRVQSALGHNWSHNFDTRLLVGNSAIDLVTYQGFHASFLRTNGQWQLQGSGNIPFQLVEQPERFLLLDPRDDRIYAFSKTTGYLIGIEDGKGNALTLAYRGPNLVSVSDVLGRALQFVYFSFQKLQSVSDGARTIRFGYQFDLLTQVTDAAAQTTSYQYDASRPEQAVLTREVRPKGNAPWRQTYDELGRVVRQTDTLTNETLFGYSQSADGFLTRVTYPIAEAQPPYRSYLHDAQGRLVSPACPVKLTIPPGNTATASMILWTKLRPALATGSPA